jgi:hypothetical protein
MMMVMMMTMGWNVRARGFIGRLYIHTYIYIYNGFGEGMGGGGVRGLYVV